MEINFDKQLGSDIRNNVVGVSDSRVTAQACLRREIEESALLDDDEFIEDFDNGDLELLVAMTKSDPKALSVSRRLACLCHMGVVDGASARAACGPCAVRRQRKRNKKVHGSNYKGPLFGTPEGDVPSKQNIIDAWRSLTGGGILVTRHSARRSGAKSLARQGWALWWIQALARHSGATIMEYVEEEVKSACQRWNAAAHGAAAAPIALMDEGHELVATLSERVKTLETMQEQLRKAEGQKPGMAALIKSVGDDEFTEYDAVIVTERRSHRGMPGMTELPRPFWRTVCGWAPSAGCKFSIFAGRRAVIGLSEQPKCKECFRPDT
jgi:hypothetical protein